MSLLHCLGIEFWHVSLLRLRVVSHHLRFPSLSQGYCHYIESIGPTGFSYVKKKERKTPPLLKICDGLIEQKHHHVHTHITIPCWLVCGYSKSKIKSRVFYRKKASQMVCAWRRTPYFKPHRKGLPAKFLVFSGCLT